MKRIFLTSGLVLCMACPAFGGGFTSSQTGTITGGCVDTNLDTTTGPVQLRASWTNKYSTIDLNNNDTNGHAADAGAVSASPDPLYGIYQDTNAVYNRTGTDDTDFTFTAQSSIAIPNGELWNFVYNANKPENASGTPTAVTPDAARRKFEGFYQNADGTGAQYIDDGGNITTPGKTAAGGYAAGSSNTWYAKYGCAKPTLADPTLTGWHFDGYYDAATGGNVVTSGTTCITSNNVPVFAHWTANQYTVNYVCGTSAQLSDGAIAAQGAATTEVATFDSPFELNAGASECVYPGRTFTGWSCVDSNGTAVNPAASATWVIDDQDAIVGGNGAVICTAQWSTNEIELHWDANHATTFAADGGSTCIYDSSITVPTQPTRTGYSFGGWQVVTYTDPGVDTGVTPAQP